MKKKLTALTLLATITFSAVLSAQEVTLPVVGKPTILEEGTQRSLSPAQIAELLPWAKNSKDFLSDLLENTDSLSIQDKIERLVDGIKQVVPDSAPKQTELFMRYALNRGLALYNTLVAEMDADAVGTLDVQYRVLRMSILLSLKYYESDLAILEKRATAPYVIFGIEYFRFLTELNKSIFDASAQYNIHRIALEWLQWDLYRDVTNTAYAPQILKINNGLKSFPTKKLKDSQSIAYIRQMKALSAQLNIESTYEKLELERKLATARTTVEKAEILRKEEEAKQAIILRAEEENRKKEEEAEYKRLGGKPDLSLKGGDLVISSAGKVRTVEYTTDDGKVVLKEDSNYYRAVDNSAAVSKLFNKLGKFNKGQVVVYNNQIRKLDYVSADNRVVLAESTNYNSAVVSARNVSLVVQSIGRFNVGDQVVSNGKVRKIEYCLDDGRVVLEETYEFYRSIVNITTVSKIQ